jgi:hypothetical protein
MLGEIDAIDLVSELPGQAPFHFQWSPPPNVAAHFARDAGRDLHGLTSLAGKALLKAHQ